MNNLQQQIQEILVSGKISSEQEKRLEKLLWRTPLNRATFLTLKRLEHELSLGNLSFE